MIMRALSLTCVCGLMLLLAGCSGYRLGPLNGEVAGAKSVQVAPFANKTVEPLLTDAVTTAVRRRLQQDGTYRLVSGEDADIVLSGEITRFDRSELSLDSFDVRTLRDYSITLQGTVSARSRSTGEVLFTQNVTGRTVARVGSDLVSAERQALPLAAKDFANNAVSLLAEGKWW